MCEEKLEHCYLCGAPVRRYSLQAGEMPPPDSMARDHVPPAGLFPSPKPSNLIAVPCCFRCNNQHSGFDDRLRIVASTPFDRNQVGQRILEEKVLPGTLAKGHQTRFVEKLLASMQPTKGRPDLISLKIDAREFQLGMIRITKGLLFALYPRFDYRKSTFCVADISPKPSGAQMNIMTMLMRAQYFERGQRVFRCWHHVEEVRGAGAWMLVFYECFGFFVFHSNNPKSDRLES